MVATLLFGTLPGICYGWPKNELHWRGIDNSIVDIALTRTPDLAIVDLQMPRLNGLDVVKKIKKSHPRVKVMVLTMHKEKEYLQKAMQFGADAFILKEDIDQVLLSAIDAVRHGRTFVSPLMNR